jgi:hypothetical protein
LVRVLAIWHHSGLSHALNHRAELGRDMPSIRPSKEVAIVLSVQNVSYGGMTTRRRM